MKTTNIGSTTVEHAIVHEDYDDPESYGYGRLTLLQPAHIRPSNKYLVPGVFVPAQTITLESYDDIKRLYELLHEAFGEQITSE